QGGVGDLLPLEHHAHDRLAGELLVDGNGSSELLDFGGGALPGLVAGARRGGGGEEEQGGGPEEGGADLHGWGRVREGFGGTLYAAGARPGQKNLPGAGAPGRTDLLGGGLVCLCHGAEKQDPCLICRRTPSSPSPPPQARAGGPSCASRGREAP